MSIFKLLFPKKFDELGRLRNEIFDLGSKISNRNDQIEKLKALIKFNEKQFEEVKNQIGDRQDELNNAVKLLKETERKLVDKSIMYDSINIELEQMQADVKVFKDEFIKVQKERDGLKELREKQLIAKRNWALKNKNKGGKKNGSK